MSRASVLLVALLILVLLSVAQVRAAREWYVAAEVMTTGTSTGFGNQNQEDGTTNTKTEDDAGGGGATTFAPLRIPETDSTPLEFDYSGGAIICVPTKIHSCRLGQTGEPDANTSYVTARVIKGGAEPDPTDTDTYSMQSLTLPTLTKITGITSFAWTRGNSSTGLIFQMYLQDPNAICSSSSTVPLTLAWVNRSAGASWPNSCDGDPWTAADVSSLKLRVIISTESITAVYGSVTYAGVIISYQPDYELNFLSEFNDVIGLSPTLQYKCTTTDEDQTLTVTYLGIERGTITCDNTRRDFALPPDVGTIQVSLRTTTTSGDTTASTFAFDLLILLTTTDSGDDDHGGPGTNLVEVGCVPSLTQIHCAANLIAEVPGLQVNFSGWYLGDRYVGHGYSIGEAPVQHFIDIDHFAISENVTVTAILFFNNGQVLQGTTWVQVNNTWIVLVVLAVVLLMVVLLIVHLVRKRSRSEARKEKKEKAKTHSLKAENWRWQLFKE